MVRVITIKHTITRELTLPEGATHVTSLMDLRETEPRFYKCTQIGVVGDHWWFWNYPKKCWHFAGHYKPHWIEELPEADVVETEASWEPEVSDED